jgi:acyl dehydratase
VLTLAMVISTHTLGADLEPETVEITPRMTLAFAAGVGDIGSRTFDDAAGCGLMAPPAFCARLEWTVLARGRAGVLGLEPAARARALHVEQDSTFHRPIRPGDRLTTSGTIVAIRPTSAGALVRTRLTTTDTGSSIPVVTSWHASIYRGIGVTGPGGSVAEPPAGPPVPRELGRRHPIPVCREAAHVYTECASIWNPIHSERKIALEQGLPDVILHGTATWATAGREIVRFYAQGDPARLKRLRATFKAPVVPGHQISLVHDAANGVVGYRVINHLGEIAVADGFAEIEV